LITPFFFHSCRADFFFADVFLFFFAIFAAAATPRARHCRRRCPRFSAIDDYAAAALAAAAYFIASFVAS